MIGRPLGFSAVLIGIAFGQPASQPTSVSAPAATGQVLSPDGAVIPGATVRLFSVVSDTSATTDASGAFRMNGVRPGNYELRVSAAGFAVARWKVLMPAGRGLDLSPLRLPPPARFRAGFVTPAGEPILNPRIVASVYDRSGRELPGDFLTQTNAEGMTTIGPLPRGVLVLLVDTPPWARQRLPETVVTGETDVTGRTIPLETGGIVDVELRDVEGAPVAGHLVFLDDRFPLAATTFSSSSASTDARGHARFERVANGRYVVKTQTLRPCGPVASTTQRGVTVSGPSPVTVRMMVSGVEVRVQTMTSGAPLAGVEVALVPDAGEPVMPRWLTNAEVRAMWLGRFFWRPIGPAPCGVLTDRRGQATIRHVPTGAATLSVRFPGSTWTRPATISPRDTDLLVDIPTGVVPLQILDEQAGSAVSGAQVVWSSNGAQVLATVPASGDLLLDGIADAPADVTVSAAGYTSYRAPFPSPPPGRHTILMERLPPRSLRCRVVSDEGKSLDNAIIELATGDPIAPTGIAGTDARGEIAFPELPEGPARLTASAPEFDPIVTQLTIPVSGGVQSVTLKRP